MPRRSSSDGASTKGVAPSLDWPGRAWRRGEESRGNPPKCEPVERAGDGAHRVIFGDALDVARSLSAAGLRRKVDLVYVDPPFASQADYAIEARLDGPADGRVRRSIAYADTWSRAGNDAGVSAYLDVLAPRLEAIAELLSDHGTMWVHLDWRASYLVRVVLDEIFGRDRFLNEIVWKRAPNLGRQAASQQFGRTLDTLLVYGGPNATLTPPTRLEPIEPSAIRMSDDEARPFTTAPRGDYTDASIAKLDREGRVHRTKSGKVYIKYFLVKNADGVWCRERRVDALWTDVPPLRHATPRERTGFPTQKPRVLLERVIACATKPGDLVVDLFSGSGTTAEAAHVLGRRAIAGDAGVVAIATTRARLLRAGAGVVIERCGSPREVKGPAIDASIAPQPHGAFKVTLKSPREPLAWAIDGSHDPSIFQVDWHSERIPGTSPTPAKKDAIVTPRAARKALAIKVYGDDGAVSTTTLPLPKARAANARTRGARA